MTYKSRLRIASNSNSVAGTYLQHLTQTHISSLLIKKGKKIITTQKWRKIFCHWTKI